MLARAHLLLLIVAMVATPCYAGKAIARDGSSVDKAIRLKQRSAKAAVEEEMAWMTKLYHYTPLLATRDVVADAVSKARATKKAADVPAPWGHASREHNGQLISYWWFLTPHGRREIYFDTGMPINTPGEVVRRESACAHYMGEMIPTLKLE